MATVPILGPQVATRPVAFVPDTNSAPATAFGDATGLLSAAKNIQGAADDISKIAVITRRQDIQDAAKKAGVAADTQARSLLYGDGTPQNPGILNQQGQSAVDAAPQAMAQLQTIQQQTAASIDDPAARNLYQRSSADRFSTLAATVAQHAAQQRRVASVDVSKSRITSAANDAAAAWNDPSAVGRSLGIAVNEANSIAQAHGYATDSDVAEAARQTAVASIFHNTFASALAADPSGQSAQKLYKQYGASIPGSARAAIENSITSATKSFQAQQRGILGGQLQDNLASLESTGRPVTPVSDAQIASAYGDQAPRIIQEQRTALATYHATQRIALSSPAEDDATLAAMAPHGVGFADQEHAQGVVARAISQKRTDLARDPATYVAMNAPGLRPMLDAAMRDPKQMGAYAAAADHAYDQLGVPTYARPLLPQAVAGDQVSKILAMAPEARGQAVTTLLQSYDPAVRGRVMADLTKAKLPPAYSTMAAMPNAGDRTTMAGAIGKATELRNSLPPGAAKTIDDALSSDANLADLRRSLSYAPDGAAQFGGIVAALQPMAYAFVAQGMSAEDAAARAAASITTSRYDFWEQSSGNVARVPRGALAATETAAGDLLSSVTADHLATPANPSGQKLTEDQLRAIALQNAQRGYWATNEADTGLVRFGANGAPVMLQNGKRLELPFQHVHTLAGGANAQQSNQAAAAAALPSILGGAASAQAPAAPIAPQY